MTNTQYKEHLAWCKKRALEYANKGALLDAVISMDSDMNKFPETKINAYIFKIGILHVEQHDVNKVIAWIEGFN